MSDKENELMEKDAMALEEVKGEMVKRSSDGSLTRSNGAQSVVNSLVVNSSTSNAVNYVFNNGSGIQIGNTYHLNWSPGTAQPSSSSATSADQQAVEAKIYRKTRTIAELMNSTERLTEQYLDIFSEYFGDRYQQLPILLNIEDLFFKRMQVDHFPNGGTKEVTRMILNFGGRS